MDLAHSHRRRGDRRAAQVESAWLDEHGRLFLAADIGPGIVHTLDMEAAADAIEAGRWQPQEMRFEALVERWRVVLSPAATRR